MPEIRDNKEPKKMKISEEPKKIKISEEPKKITIPEELMEINSPKEDENTTGWFDKNKFEKILATVNSDKFSHKNKIGRLRYNDIKNLVDGINKNTISEIYTKENINALN